MQEEMAGAYYYDKVPMYLEQIKDGSRKVVTFETARKIFIEDLKQYNVKAAFAHNARFDLNALNTTLRYLTKSKNRFFFPYGTEIWDTLKMSKVLYTRPTYKKFCEKYDFMTNHKKPRPQAKAETLYRYITNNPDFEESHTGLEDVLIETVIFAKCFATHQKMEKRLFE